MVEIDFSSCDCGTPLGRRAALMMIPPDRAVARKYHSELLELFRQEMAYRREDFPEGYGESDCFEQIYWCGLLLYLVGDPADVPLMWEGKQINMDTGTGFDGQVLVGAGVEKTIKYLEETGQKKPAEYLEGMRASKELDDLSEWEELRVDYFYPDKHLST
jgi:hypothetical protein